jgi:hypothetical protein
MMSWCSCCGKAIAAALIACQVCGAAAPALAKEPDMPITQVTAPPVVIQETAQAGRIITASATLHIEAHLSASASP